MKAQLVGLTTPQTINPGSQYNAAARRPAGHFIPTSLHRIRDKVFEEQKRRPSGDSVGFKAAWDRVIEMVAHERTLTAHCLKEAYSAFSPTYGTEERKMHHNDMAKDTPQIHKLEVASHRPFLHSFPEP